MQLRSEAAQPVRRGIPKTHAWVAYTSEGNDTGRVLASMDLFAHVCVRKQVQEAIQPQLITEDLQRGAVASSTAVPASLANKQQQKQQEEAGQARHLFYLPL